MEPTPQNRTEVIKLFIQHHELNAPTLVAIDEKGDEYELTVYIDGDHIYPGTYSTLSIEAQKITD